MAIPHYVNENKSDMWSIKPGMVRDGRRRQSYLPGRFPAARNASIGALSQRTDRPRQSCVYGQGETIRTDIRPAFKGGGYGGRPRTALMRDECHDRRHHWRQQS